MAFDESNAEGIIGAGAIVHLLSLLRLTEDMLTKQYTIIALAILDNSIEKQQQISAVDGIKVLLSNLQSMTEPVTKRCAIAGLANLLQRSPDIISEPKEVIYSLLSLVNTADDLLTQRYGLVALVNLTKIELNQDIIRECNGIKPLIVLLQNSNDLLMRRYIALLLGNLAVRNNKNSDKIQELGGIIPLITLLDSEDILTQRGTVIALMNLTNTELNKNVIGECNGIKPLIVLLQNSDDLLKYVSSRVNILKE